MASQVLRTICFILLVAAAGQAAPSTRKQTNTLTCRNYIGYCKNGIPWGNPPLLRCDPQIDGNCQQVCCALVDDVPTVTPTRRTARQTTGVGCDSWCAATTTATSNCCGAGFVYTADAYVRKITCSSDYSNCQAQCCTS